MSSISSDDLHRIFKNLDKNNNGQVNIQDLHNLLDKIQIDTTLEEVEVLVGKSVLDYNDFLFFYESMVNAEIADNHDHAGDDLFKAFKLFDLNGDGYISCDELQSVLLRLELLDHKQSRRDCRDMMCVFDKNNDGVLDFEEFKDMMFVPSNSNTDSDS